MEQSDRRKRGVEIWETVTQSPVSEPDTPFREAVLDFVSAEVWSRPGLTMKERRWISLSCAGMSGVTIPIRAHVRAALESGDVTVEELQEFLLHFAAYAGWPRASLVNSIITEYLESR